jgi:hypothetical protein
MATHVVMCLELMGFCPDYKNALAENVQNAPVPWIRKLLLTPGAKPLPGENEFLFLFENFLA